MERLGAIRTDRRREFPRHPQTGRVLALHHVRRVVVWTCVVAAVAVALCLLERMLQGQLPGDKIAAKPLSLARRVFGFPHFLIAIYFLVTSRRMTSLRGWLWLAGLVAASVVLCAGFGALGGEASPVAYILVNYYFLFHAFRDESFFYRTWAGEAIAPREHSAARQLNVWMEVAALSFVAALVIPFHIAYNRRADGAFEDPTVLMAGAAVSLLAVCAFALARLHRSHPRGLSGVVADHWPLVRVLVGYDVLLLSGLVIGAWTIEFLVLLHFVAWFYFTTVRLAQQPRPEGVTWRTPHRWVRSTARGFWVLHGGLVGVTLLAYVLLYWVLPPDPVWVAGQEYRSAWAVPLGEACFYHLTVAHVTLSLMPR